MRVSGIENKGGYAANANLNFNLWRFCFKNATGAISTVGFGAITQKPAESKTDGNFQFPWLILRYC